MVVYAFFYYVSSKAIELKGFASREKIDAEAVVEEK